MQSLAAFKSADSGWVEYDHTESWEHDHDAGGD